LNPTEPAGSPKDLANTANSGVGANASPGGVLQNGTDDAEITRRRNSPEKRHPSENEINSLFGPVFGKSIDYSKVEFWSCCAMPTAPATTFGNIVMFAPEYYSPDFSQAPPYLKSLASHEMTHVWGRQHSEETGYATWKAALESLLYGRSGAYEYKLDGSRALTSYRFEQQGQIVQDYVLRKFTNQPVSDYENVIYKSIDKERK
jgi:hypothetical protein